MAAKATRKKAASADSDGIFAGIVAFLIDMRVQPRRLQIWKQKLLQMGATIEEALNKRVTHVFAMNLDALLQEVSRERMARFKGSVLLYQWLEDCLSLGEKVSEDLYHLKVDVEGENVAIKSLISQSTNRITSSDDEPSPAKRIRFSSNDSKNLKPEHNSGNDSLHEESNFEGDHDGFFHTQDPVNSSLKPCDTPNKNSSLPYSPPDLNRNITDIFGKLINIYRALGDDRRSFSYYKAIPVIEKLPFKIESVDQVKHLPSIGKSMQDHIQEIVMTGKLSKLEHFEVNEKVRTISLFGEVWGIGPATAAKLYEKGHRTLDDLKKDDSLTNSQKIGLKYFDDINTRIPRHEVQEMEKLLRKVAEDILPGVVVVCGGSFRRGKASCGDMDIIITHPDGKSHKGFLAKFAKLLKDMDFLREDLVFSSHSEEGINSGVDTYFGLCTYPGRELRHRIDFKVFPRDIYAFGLIAWTGNDVLNRRLRLLADSKGYRLDDTGMFPATQGSNGKKGARGSASLRFETEKEVFDFLGFHWLEPHERNL